MRCPACSKCCLLLVSLLVLLLEEPWTAHGQGLRFDEDAQDRGPGQLNALSSVFRFRSAFGSLPAWNNAVRTNKRSSTCSQLCGGSSPPSDVLLLATAPQAYDARSQFNNLEVVGPVKDQGDCGMCVAFAVLAAAQTTAAVVLQQSFIDSTLSEQDFYMCLTQDEEASTCRTGWNLREGMRAFARLQRTKQLPVVEACRPYAPSKSTAASCKRSCDTMLPQLGQGLYQSLKLSSIAEMQQHIRQHGSIVCSMQLYSDTREFFDRNGSAVYKGPGAKATKEEGHAVQVAGYDNSRQAWLIKNSWGQGFGKDGFAWVAFDAPRMCEGGNAFGFLFAPLQPQPADQLRLKPAPNRPGCFAYRAVAGDYPQRVASRVNDTHVNVTNVILERLLLDNLNVFKGDPSTLRAGTILLLCGPEVVAAAAAAGGGPSWLYLLAGLAARNEVAALLAIKAVLDPAGTALTDWQPGSSTPCNWTGVTCGSKTKRVISLDLWDDRAQKGRVQVSGQLPSGALLRRLPGLVWIDLRATGVSGTLPEDWSQLRQLEDVYISGNKLGGTLPTSWGALSKLRACRLGYNRLSGPLPATWSKMGALRDLGLLDNALTGTLPSSWSQLAALTDLRLGNNNLSGTLPLTWAALSRLRVCYLFVNRLSGTLPATWSRMAALEALALSNNALTGTVPSSWGSWRQVEEVTLWNNPKLTGCLPTEWGGTQLFRNRKVVAEGPFKGKDTLTAGTGITGFC